jgi:hypothetical protein
MRRREFITVRSGAAAIPFVAQAQQSERPRRIGGLMPFPIDNSEGQARIATFLQELRPLGWNDGRNLQIEYRWEAGDLRKAATELVTLSPDVPASTTLAMTALQQADKQRLTVQEVERP